MPPPQNTHTRKLYWVLRLSHIEHVGQSFSNTCFLVSIVGATPNYVKLKYRCPTKKINWIRGVYLKLDWLLNLNHHNLCNFSKENILMLWIKSPWISWVSWGHAYTSDHDNSFLLTLIGSDDPTLFYTRSPQIRETMGEHVRTWMRKWHVQNV